MCYIQEISKSCEFVGVGSAIGVGFVIIWARLVLQGLSKSFEFAGARSAVVLRFDYPGFDHRALACVTGHF